MMEKLLILNTGGTFNKVYNPLKGELEVPKDAKAPEAILRYFYNTSYQLINIIHKDSLEMNDEDRALILHHVEQTEAAKILIIHGTDTMDITATFLDLHVKHKMVLLTGAMVPFSIDSIEATANLSMALGALQEGKERGIYIAMHGLVAKHDAIYKNREKGIFELRS